MRIASFFAGAGGLDRGFESAGFQVVWANEYDRDIWATYRQNHPRTVLDTRSIVNVAAEDVPDCDGIIGGPPCQSWSEAGALRGINDKRGQLFFDFIRILKAKQPKFFLAENVSGMLLPTHAAALANIKQLFQDAGYTLSWKLLNACDYNVPQERKRVFFIGIRHDLGAAFQFPTQKFPKISLQQAIGDLQHTPLPARTTQRTNGTACTVTNHEYMTGGFSTIFMSRNRVRGWDEQSFTIQAGGRHAPLHPQAPKMPRVALNKHVFVEEAQHLYRRLTVRECARVQTFPDDFVFHYDNVAAGYKMVGNAVPVQLAKFLAESIRKQVEAALSFERLKAS